jgi:hypothetical protein
MPSRRLFMSDIPDSPNYRQNGKKLLSSHFRPSHHLTKGIVGQRELTDLVVVILPLLRPRRGASRGPQSALNRICCYLRAGSG